MGREIKATSEIQGRTESTLVDVLNVAYDYDVNQDALLQHIEDNELSL